MPVYSRSLTLPVQLTAADAAAADRDTRDLAEAVADAVEARDVTGSLTVGRVEVTVPAPARAVYLAAYGAGPLATERVVKWLTAGVAVDSRLTRGGWVHRPAQRPGEQSEAER